MCSIYLGVEFTEVFKLIAFNSCKCSVLTSEYPRLRKGKDIHFLGHFVKVGGIDCCHGDGMAVKFHKEMSAVTMVTLVGEKNLGCIFCQDFVCTPHGGRNMTL